MDKIMNDIRTFTNIDFGDISCLMTTRRESINPEVQLMVR